MAPRKMSEAAKKRAARKRAIRAFVDHYFPRKFTPPIPAKEPAHATPLG